MMPKEFFTNQIASREAHLKTLTRKSAVLSTVRFTLFLTGLVGFIVLVNFREMQWAFIEGFGFLGLFLVVLKVHNLLKFKKKQEENLVNINKLELERMAGNYQDLNEGNIYRSDGHPYTADLDVFGKNSLFQLFNRTTSIMGEELLAERLKKGLNYEAAGERQNAVRTITQQPEWLQAYQAYGMHFITETGAFERFQIWSNEKSRILGVKWLNMARIILPILLLIGAIYCALTGTTYYILLPIVIINGAILGRYWTYASETVEQTSKALSLMKSLRLQMKQIEALKLEDDFSRTLAEPFIDEHQNANGAIGKLNYYLNQLETRTNMLHIFFNITFLLDVQWLLKLEQWKVNHGEEMNIWFQNMAEFEVLISLAGVAFANPDWSLPQTSANPYHIEAKSMGHPMIQQDSRICNDFVLSGKGQVVLLTGPNMAGKSTFLRTMAVNIVLARLGGPVCAAAFTIDFNMQVFTAMRVADDLSENVSSFYAEINRIHSLLELVNKGEQVLYFLDEILKGTNSADRHKGAEGLIKQLSKSQVTGFISTHDLELGALAEEMSAVSNYSFESTVEGNEVVFDYTLRPGISSSFNACELMRKMGIEV